MGILRADDPLPSPPRRVIVAGTSGAGKTTLARQIGRILGLPHTELDSLFHGPNWVPRHTFQADVDRIAAGSSWVSEWQYGPVRSLLADRCDLLVWLDLPRRTVMRQVIMRTLRRRLRREELWNGNTEGPLHTFVTDPDHIVRWAWKQHSRIEEKVMTVRAGRPELPIVRLLSRAEAERWCQGLVTYQQDGL